MIIVSLTGCKKWLDTDTPLQVDENTVLLNEQGFKEALNGVYLQMGGKKCVWKRYDFWFNVCTRQVMTHHITCNANLYYQGARYNFAGSEVKTTFKNIWESSYISIANLNNILDNVESRQMFLQK
jgi:hypothetical protein